MTLHDWRTQFGRGLKLSALGFHHAALEIWLDLVNQGPPSTHDLAKLYDELGKTYLQIGQLRAAYHYVEEAIQLAPRTEDEVTYRVHLALVAQGMSDYDKAQRILTQLKEEYETSINSRQRALLHANLGAIVGLNGFYSEGIKHTLTSIEDWKSIDETNRLPILYNNLGALCLQAGDLESAGNYLRTALAYPNANYLSTISDLSTLYMLQGALEQSLHYAEQALAHVWSAVVNSEKNDFAVLCRLLANLARHIGEHQTSLRLLEKSELLFGQLSMWREWNEVQRVMDSWLDNETLPSPIHNDRYSRGIHQFRLLLDATNAQELIHPDFNLLLDSRVIYVQALAEELNLASDVVGELIYAARFADYGLTALEPEVVENPNRSETAWQQYRMHPTFSVDMLRTANLPDHVLRIIIDHHERIDGTGYPNGKGADSIEFAAQILAVPDFYSTAMVLRGLTHTQAIEEIRQLAGTSFNPDIVRLFVNLFDIENIR